MDPSEQGVGGGAGATMSTRALGGATVLAALGAVVIIAIAAWDSRGGSHGGDGGAFVVERAPAETATPARGYANGAARPATTVRVPSPHRPVLVALYEATRGESWLNATHWLSDRPIEDWYGVSTDSAGRVTSLRLTGNRLSGPLPPEIGNLATLQHLALNSNELSGWIPAELGNLASLRDLHLDGNYLYGPIPPELANLRSLDAISLAGNDLAGCIPPALRAAPSNDFDRAGLPFCE